MLATTCGVTHKNDVVIDTEYCQRFIKDQTKIFRDLSKKNSVLYSKDTKISDTSLNYLNILTKNKTEEALKNMILKEYYECESIYPYLGDLFLHKLFKENYKVGRNIFVFEKRHESGFLSSIKNYKNKQIAKWFFDNSNLNRNINVEKYKGNEFIFEYTKDFVFDVSFENSFYEDDRRYECKKYKYVIINGYIDSVGELHHLFHKANQSKIPYVIFCMGMNDEVKSTIIKNNRMNRFEVYPVCFSINNEYSLNLLNDIAAIHGGSIVSSDLGQTISQEVRKELDEGNYICLSKDKITIRSNVSEEAIQSHRSFLKKRIDEAHLKTDVRIDVLQKRLKMFTNNKLNIYLPSIFLEDKDVAREIDYIFRILGFLNKKLKIVEVNNQKFYFPIDYVNISEKKQKSLKSKFAEISALVS